MIKIFEHESNGKKLDVYLDQQTQDLDFIQTNEQHGQELVEVTLKQLRGILYYLRHEGIDI